MREKSKTTRLAILGGTFDPPHVGHLLMAQTALETLALDGVIFVPSGDPPHKDLGDIRPAEDRIEMIRAATAWNPRFHVDDLERHRQGKTYTIDTVMTLRDRHPDAELFFLIGADSLNDLYTWMRVEELLTLCRFITFIRPGQAMETLQANVAKLPQPWATQLLQDVHQGRAINISSTECRQRVAQGLSIRYLVPKEVEAYIAAHDLYAPTTGNDGT
ncbi:MAG: nicotinate-nucleotide adenylyltransferase [Kiritimatiellae bacterium]|nr:nicotinate-nucleotide adenylyltransferase [Kiritimatiellia bacterium]